ncbi:MAG: hypothetical protein ABSA52_13150 [Candidatus Binatia bacterium]
MLAVDVRRDHQGDDDDEHRDQQGVKIAIPSASVPTPNDTKAKARETMWPARRQGRRARWESRGLTWPPFYCESRQTSFDVAVERDTFGGTMRPLIGIGVRYTDIRDFTGSKVDTEDSSGHDVTAIEQPPRMHTDCQDGVITGCHGGFENLLKLGISLDTLDFEPDPILLYETLNKGISGNQPPLRSTQSIPQ